MMQQSSMVVASPDFHNGGVLPLWCAHPSVGGDNVSPALEWHGAPAGTSSLALTCHDPDEPTGVGFVHWLLFNLKPAITSLARGDGAPGRAPAGAESGFTDWGATCYDGPAPTPGDAPHNYQFVLWALDVSHLDCRGVTTTYAMLQYMMRGHVLASARLVGKFQTPPEA